MNSNYGFFLDNTAIVFWYKKYRHVIHYIILTSLAWMQLDHIWCINKQILGNVSWTRSTGTWCKTFAFFIFFILQNEIENVAFYIQNIRKWLRGQNFPVVAGHYDAKFNSIHRSLYGSIHSPWKMGLYTDSSMVPFMVPFMAPSMVPAMLPSMVPYVNRYKVPYSVLIAF